MAGRSVDAHPAERPVDRQLKNGGGNSINNSPRYSGTMVKVRIELKNGLIRYVFTNEYELLNKQLKESSIVKTFRIVR